MSIANFPMVRGQLDEIEKSAQRTTAGVFKFYQQLLSLKTGLVSDNETSESIEIRKYRFDIREIIMLQKITTSKETVDTIRKAMSIFGGHGVIEDFSSLPRLFRDAIVNELWEGPRNVLLAQIHRDIKRASSWYAPTEFVSRVLRGLDDATIKSFAKEMDELIRHASLTTMDDRTIDVCTRWDDYCQRFFRAYQENALSEVNQSN